MNDGTRCLLAALAVTLSAPLGCSALSEDAATGSNGGGLQDTFVASDTLGGFDVFSDTGIFPPTEPDTANEPGASGGAFTQLKPEPGYLIPGNIVTRRAPTLRGALSAWIETEEDGSAPQIVVWDLEGVSAAATPIAAAPRAYVLPQLTNPRDLRLGDGYAVYVDDRFGDADIFALDLETGTERAVIATFGPQEEPTIDGTVVVWSDCRACVSGDGGQARELYRRDLAGGPEERLTDNARADRLPVWGTLADGSTALAWSVDGGTLRVVSSNTDVSLTLPKEPRALALSEGVVAWRPVPVVINPDSMYPSELWTTRVVTGATVLTYPHLELPPTASPQILGAAGAFAWLDGEPGSGRPRLRVVGIDGQTATTVTTLGMVDFALSDTHTAFVAPRADNDDLDDLWIADRP